MTYLVMQMLLCLILAFLLGMLVGWWLGRRKAEESARAIEAKDREVLDCRVDLKEARGQLKECQSGLEASQSELEKIRGQLKTSEGERDDIRGQLKTSEGELDDARGQLKTSESELDDARGQLEACRSELEECRAASDQDQGAGDSGAAGAGAVISTLMGGAAAADDAEPDDLKVVEGIGPKIESLLNAGGISTWVGLAKAEISYLQSILDDAGPRYRIHDPGTWPQQAALAAAGSWEELEELQDRLKGGRET